MACILSESIHPRPGEYIHIVTKIYISTYTENNTVMLAIAFKNLMKSGE